MCIFQKVWDSSDSLNGNSCLIFIRSTIPMISGDLLTRWNATTMVKGRGSKRKKDNFELFHTFGYGSFVKKFWVSKVRFRRRTFHDLNLIHWIKYMKSSASKSIRNACFNLERLSRSFRLVRSGVSPLERLWNGFDSDAELFIYRT